MLAGVSTACFYPQYTEKAMRALTAYPPDAVEVFINAAGELDSVYLHELRRIADDSGMRIVSVHPYTSGIEQMYFFSSYDRRFEEGMNIYRRYYQAANILGAGIVVFHGATRFWCGEYKEYAERYGRLLDDANRYGVQLCHENVERCIGRTPRFFREMRRLLPQAGFVLDFKQAIRAGEKIENFIFAMEKNILHIHISDHDDFSDCLVPGLGSLNIRNMLMLAAQNEFDGSVVVELYQENYNSIVEIFAGFQQIATTISTI